MFAARSILPIFLIFSLWLSACGDGQVAPETSQFYLVRHAEKAKGDNPGLTPDGQARAQALAERFANEPVHFIHSTNYNRTLETAAPLAKAKDLEINIYKDYSVLAEDIRTQPGTHIIVGHSNTTPELAGLLSGQVMDVMSEDEYDRFIAISLKKSGELNSVEISTYGASQP